MRVSNMKKNLFKKLAVVQAAALVASGSAHAALPAEVTTALADMKTDGVTIAGAVLVAIIAITAIKLLRKGT